MSNLDDALTQQNITYHDRIVDLQWYRIVHRYRCPYPVIADFSARACVAAGLCGCDNRKRYPQVIEGERQDG